MPGVLLVQHEHPAAVVEADALEPAVVLGGEAETVREQHVARQVEVDDAVEVLLRHPQRAVAAIEDDPLQVVANVGERLHQVALEVQLVDQLGVVADHPQPRARVVDRHVGGLGNGQGVRLEQRQLRDGLGCRRGGAAAAAGDQAGEHPASEGRGQGPRHRAAATHSPCRPPGPDRPDHSNGTPQNCSSSKYRFTWFTPSLRLSSLTKRSLSCLSRSRT